jgi:hypothetical protein
MAPKTKAVPATAAKIANIPRAPTPASPLAVLPASPLAAAYIPVDFHYALNQILTPANIEAFKVIVITAGTIAAKAAVEVFVEQVKIWFTKKRSIEGFEITPPVGTTIDSLKIEGKQVVITLKALATPLAPSLAPVLATPLSTSSHVPNPLTSVKKKKK